MKKILSLFYVFVAFFACSPTLLKATQTEEVYNNCYQNCYQDNYIYRWNISANPLGWVCGYYYGASVAYALNSNVAVRGNLGVRMLECDTSRNGVEFTAGLPIYFYSVYNGFFIEPQISTGIFSGNYHSGSFGVVGGYHWMWDSGWNISAAVGVGTSFHHCCCESGLRGYLQVGYNF